MRRRVAVVALAAVACSSPASTGAPEGGVPSGEDGSGGDSASAHGERDAGKRHDGASAADASGESGSGDGHRPLDARAPPPSTTLILVAASAASAGLAGSRFTATDGWGAMAMLAMGGVQANSGLSTVLLPGQLGFAAASSGSRLGMASWSGVWSALSAISPGNVRALGPLVPTPTGASIAYVGGGQTVFYAEYDASSAEWSANEQTPSAVNQPMGDAPALAITGGQDPLIVTPSGGEAGPYQWSVRSAGGWSAPIAVPNLSANVMPPGPWGGGALATRVGGGETVGVFDIQNMQGVGSLVSSTYAAGAWATSAISVPLPGSLGFDAAPPELAALPDGSVAAVCAVDGDGGAPAIAIGFYAGPAGSGSWGSFNLVPNVAPYQSGHGPGTSYAIAPGVGGAVLELVYVDTNEAIQHVRLTSETPIQWTMPAAVASGQFNGVSIASGP